MKRDTLWWAGLALLVILVIVFIKYPTIDIPTSELDSELDALTTESEAEEKTNSEEQIIEEARWQDIELKDIATQEIFTISGFAGKPVLLESFAVWCPTCTRQQKELKTLHEELGDSVISVSLDTDPNEDEQAVKNHIDKNGFNWFYAVAPAEMTKMLIDEFGIGIVNAPSVPVVLICEDQTTRLLKTGVKDSEELKSEIEQGC